MEVHERQQFPLRYVVMEDSAIWMTTRQASGALGVNLRTLYRFIDLGDLPAYKFGRVIRLKRIDVDGFLERSRIVPGSLEHLYPEHASHAG